MDWLSFAWGYGAGFISIGVCIAALAIFSVEQIHLD